ncbi:MAG: MBL fold metallo-hydrolase [Deltaproteobacteria bacterium]|nr:MBL fold metallo-hydrolase [Deltaproteobacteria bacterium]
MSTVNSPIHYIKEIADSFYMITTPMPFRLGHVNAFLVVHDKEAALFDTGLNMSGTLPKIEASLESVGLSIENIGHIFLTHSHADHCGVAGLIKERSGAIIHMSEEGKRHIEMMKDEELRVKRMRGFLCLHGLPEKTLDFIAKMFDRFKDATIPFEVDEILNPCKTYETCGRTFKAIPTPGHANGHNCFYFGNENILLSGDHVLPDITPNLSPDLFDPEFQPLNAFLSSLDRVKDLPVEMVYPSHGAPFPNLNGRVAEMKEHHRERTGLILDAIRKGRKTTFQISLDIWGGNLSQFDKFLAINETYVHILELLKEGSVREENNGRNVLYVVA